MKAVKLVQISTEMLKVLSENGIRIDDYKYVDVYYSFLNMRNNRVKHRVAVKILAGENNISERTLERIFKRLSKVVN